MTNAQTGTTKVILASMNKAVLYSTLLATIIGGITLTVIFAPMAAPIAVPVYASVAVGVLALLQGTNAAVAVQEVKETAKEAAVAVQEVKETAKEAVVAAEAQTAKIDALAVVARNTQRMGEATHTLVNSDMGRQLKLAAVQARRLAILTAEAVDIAAADESERLLDEHMKKQEVVDSRPPAGPTTSGEAPASPDVTQSSVTSAVDVQTISPEAAQSIADAMSPHAKEDAP